MTLQNILNEGIEVTLLPILHHNTVRDGAVVQYTIVEEFPIVLSIYCSRSAV